MKKITKFAMSFLTLIFLTGCNKAEDTTSKAEVSSQQEQLSTDSQNSSNAPTSSAKAENAEKITLTFKWNFANQKDTTSTQSKDSYLSFPEMVAREGYLFSYWSLDESGNQVLDLSEKITKATTLYANWIEDNDNAVTVTFHTNIQDQDDVYMKMSITKGTRLKSFPSIEREQHLFKGWYNSTAFDKTVTKTAKYDSDSDVYARWYTQTILEAEYTKLTDLTKEEDPYINDFGEKTGHGYSSDVSGTGLIFQENANLKASNGYFINDLYYKDAFIQFDFTCEKEILDASLTATLSAEYFDMTFTKDTWMVQVNGESIDYGTISLTNVPTGRDTALKRPFSTHNLTNTLHLNKGKNTIKLITNNEIRHDSTGTMKAEAPMIDCISIFSDVSIDFDAHLDNLL